MLDRAVAMDKKVITAITPISTESAFVDFSAYLGIEFRLRGRGEALLFRGKVKADFYPSTGRWRSGNKTYRGGAKSFLNWWRQKNPVNGLNQNMIIRDKASNMTVFDQQEEDWFDNDCKGEIGDY